MSENPESNDETLTIDAPTACVAPNIDNIVRKILTALGDNSAKPRFLKTVVGKGYRFIGPVRVIDARYPHSDLESGTIHAVGPEEAGGWSERSSLAVVPLMLLGNTTDDQGISLGFADVLVARLGNLSVVDVLPIPAVLKVPVGAAASASAFRLGVRFVLRGAICASVLFLRTHLPASQITVVPAQ